VEQPLLVSMEQPLLVSVEQPIGFVININNGELDSSSVAPVELPTDVPVEQPN